LCVRAHYWTSFRPEQRGEMYVREYSQMLDSDIEQLRNGGADDETISRYETKFENLFVAWMHRKCNCFSSMITGPSKFPTRKAEKANRSEENAYNIFNDWRNKFFKRVNREARPTTPDGELEKARTDLARRSYKQKYMKEINAICRKSNAVELLTEMGIKPQTIHSLLNPPYSYQSKGFQSYELTNNNANIKRLESRVEELENKIALREKQKESGEVKGWQFDGGEVQVNYEADRVQILFDEKPDDKTRKELKSHGYRWSPTYSAWQRKITDNALYATKQLCKPIAKTIFAQ